jgi:hypothetical protein
VAEENFCGLSDAAADGKARLEVSKRECQEHFKELTLLQNRGSSYALPLLARCGGDAGCCPLPHRDGQRAGRASGGDVLCRGVGARALTR